MPDNHKSRTANNAPRVVFFFSLGLAFATALVMMYWLVFNDIVMGLVLGLPAGFLLTLPFLMKGKEGIESANNTDKE